MKFYEQLATDLSYPMLQKNLIRSTGGYFFGGKSLRIFLMAQNWQDGYFYESSYITNISSAFSKHNMSFLKRVFLQE